MKYVNKTCDATLKRNFQVKNYTSENSVVAPSLFSKNKKIKITY